MTGMSWSTGIGGRSAAGLDVMERWRSATRWPTCCSPLGVSRTPYSAPSSPRSPRVTSWRRGWCCRRCSAGSSGWPVRDSRGRSRRLRLRAVVPDLSPIRWPARPSRIAANLSMDTLKAVCGREALAARGRGDAVAAGGVLGRAARTPVRRASEPILVGASDVLRAGRDRGVIDEPVHALLVSVYVDELTGSEAAGTALDECGVGTRALQPGGAPAGRPPERIAGRCGLRCRTDNTSLSRETPAASRGHHLRPTPVREGGAMTWAGALATRHRRPGLARLCCIIARLVQAPDSRCSRW